MIQETGEIGMDKKWGDLIKSTFIVVIVYVPNKLSVVYEGGVYKQKTRIILRVWMDVVCPSKVIDERIRIKLRSDR